MAWDKFSINSIHINSAVCKCSLGAEVKLVLLVNGVTESEVALMIMDILKYCKEFEQNVSLTKIREKQYFLM